MRNKRGEVIAGVMVVTMVAMMSFGGMHMMGGTQSEGDHQQTEQMHNHDEDRTQHVLNHAGGQDPFSSQAEAK